MTTIYARFKMLSIFSLQSLNKIIQRDFFPELPKLRAQHEYLDAVEHNDVEKLREISARYQASHTPGGHLGEYTVIFKQGSTSRQMIYKPQG